MGWPCPLWVQKRTCALHYPMSTLPPKATSLARLEVRQGPIADIGSLDKYIHALQKFVGNAQAQRFRSLEVDDELILGGLFNRYVLRTLALKYPLHKFRAVPNCSGAISPE